MTIKENPFYILGATLRDNRQKLMSLAEEKSLEIDESICSEARMVLTNPRRRLSAELSWFPGVSLKDTSTILSKLKFGVLEDEFVAKLPPLVRFNLSLGMLLSSKRKPSDTALEKTLFEMAQSYESINIENLLKVINEERGISGFSEISDTSTIAEEMENIRVQAIQSIQEMVSGRSLTSLNHIMMGVLKREEKSGLTLELVQDYIDKIYAMAVQKDLESINGKIKTSIENIKKESVRKNVSKSYLTKLIDNFLEELEDYDNIMQPLQVSMQNRGLEHEISHDMAEEVRKLAIHVGAKANALDLSEKIVKKAKELFAEVSTSSEHLSEDLIAIKDIREAKVRQEKEIECSFTHDGAFGQETLSMSKKGIEYNGSLYKLEDITNIRYGLKGDSGGIVSLVGFGTESEDVEIKWLKGSIYTQTLPYNRFTAALWKAVGPQIITNMLNQLALGKSVYGVLYDDGMKLRDDYYYDSKKFKWSDISVKASDGKVIISSKSSPRYKLEWSLMLVENAIVMYILLNLFMEKGPSSSISQTFGVTKEEAKAAKKVEFPEQIQEHSMPMFNVGTKILNFFIATWWIWLFLLIAAFAE